MSQTPNTPTNGRITKTESPLVDYCIGKLELAGGDSVGEKVDMIINCRYLNKGVKITQDSIDRIIDQVKYKIETTEDDASLNKAA